MMPLRIAYVVHQQYRWQAFEWVARELDPSRCEPVFALLHDGEAAHACFLRAQGVPVEHVPFRGRPDLPRAIATLCCFFRRRGVDLVHAHFIDAGLAGLTAARLLGIPGVHTRHHAGPTPAHPRTRAGLWIDRLVNRLSNRVIAPSALVARVLIATDGCDPGKIVAIPHGFAADEFLAVEPARIERLRTRYGLPSGGPVIGCVARYLRLKGHRYLIEAFRRLLVERPDARLVLANARGRHAGEIRALLHALPTASYVEIAFEEDMAALYRLFDALVHVPLQDCEAFGQVYVEALAAGIPSIFTSTGIAAEAIIHRREAWLVDFENSDQILAGLRELLGNRELRETLIANGRRTAAERFGIAGHTAALERLYLDMVAVARGGRL